MTLRECFDANLTLAREENPTQSLAHNLELAMDWTLADLARQAAQLSEHYLAAHIDAVNKAHFDGGR